MIKLNDKIKVGIGAGVIGTGVLIATVIGTSNKRRKVELMIKEKELSIKEEQLKESFEKKKMASEKQKAKEVELNELQNNLIDKERQINAMKDGIGDQGVILLLEAIMDIKSELSEIKNKK